MSWLSLWVVGRNGVGGGWWFKLEEEDDGLKKERLSHPLRDPLTILCGNPFPFHTTITQNVRN